MEIDLPKIWHMPNLLNCFLRIIKNGGNICLGQKNKIKTLKKEETIINEQNNDYLFSKNI